MPATRPASPQLQKLIDALPYPGLSLIEHKVLAGYMSPESGAMNQYEKATLAEVDPASWARIMAKPAFQEICVKVARAHIRSNGKGILDKFIEKAQSGGVDGKGDIQAQLVLLRQCGYVDQDKHSNVTNVFQGLRVEYDNKRAEIAARIAKVQGDKVTLAEGDAGIVVDDTVSVAVEHGGSVTVSQGDSVTIDDSIIYGRDKAMEQAGHSVRPHGDTVARPAKVAEGHEIDDPTPTPDPDNTGKGGIE